MLPQLLSLKTAAIAGAIALAVGAAGGGLLVHQFYAPRLELAQSQVKQLGEKIDEQNKAIERLRTEAEAREKAAAAAVAAALKEARKFEADAQRILSRQKPASLSECKAVEALFREELRK